MSDPVDLSDAIANAAQGPLTVSVDGQLVTAQDLSKLAEADRYLAAKAAATKKHRGLRITKLLPPGAV